MINKTEWNRMMEGKLYNPYKVGDNSFENVHAAQKKFNESEYWNDKRDRKSTRLNSSHNA